MYEVVYVRRFKKAYKRLLKSGSFDDNGLQKVYLLLKEKKELPYFYRDHALKGDFEGYRECHIESDLLLLYEVDNQNNTLTFVDIGSHSALFG